MKKYRILLLATLTMAVACHEVEPEPSPEPEPLPELEFIGIIDNGAAKASMSIVNEQYKGRWTVGDQVLITNGTATGTFTVDEGDTNKSQLSLTSGTKPESGTFTAYYPADLPDNMVLPSVRAYALPPFENSPMMAISNSTILPFKSLCGMLCIDLTSAEPVRIKTLGFTAEQGLSGAFTIENDKAVVAGNEGITIDCGEGIEISDTAVPFFLEVPANEYSGLNLKAIDINGREYLLEGLPKVMTVDRACLYEYGISFQKLEMQKAVLPDGKTFNIAAKTATGMKVSAATKACSAIARIEFVTLSDNTEGTEIQDPASDKKIYLKYTAADSSIVVTTSASEFFVNPDPSFMFTNMTYVRDIKNLESIKTDGITTTRSMFESCKALQKIDLATFDTGDCTDMARMFSMCNKLTEVNLKGMNTSKVTKMDSMFYCCLELPTVDVTTFDTHNVESSSSFFSSCGTLKSVDLSNFDTAKNTDMSYFFYSCRALKETGNMNFDLTRMTDLKYFFYGCEMLETLHLTTWNLSLNRPNINYFFYNMCSARELHLGSNFKLGNSPSCLFTEASQTSKYFGSTSGMVNIYCSPTVADWLATTTLRWVNSKYQNKTKNVEIHFIQWDTGGELDVNWSSN